MKQIKGINEINNHNSETLWIEFSPEDIKKAWPSDNLYSNNIANWNGYLNQLCLNSFIPWLEELIIGKNNVQFSVWPSIEALPSIWEVVNGIAINFGETRLILICSEETELEELRIPREWVDISSWAGDYYLAVQIDLDEEADKGSMRVLGYTTHQQIKLENNYDRLQGVYVVKSEDLIPGFTTLWLAQKLRPYRRVKVQEIPTLLLEEAQELLRDLGQPSFYSPRLRMVTNLPFEKWAALLVNDNYRQELYQRRLGNIRDNEKIVTESPVANKSMVKLNQWFQNICEAGWRNVEEIWENFGMPEANLVYSWRNKPQFRGISLETQEAIPTVISLLQNNSDKFIRLPAIQLLGRIASGNQAAIAALTDIIKTSPDENIRYEAAVSLGNVDRQNPLAGARRAKVIDLGMQIDNNKFALTLTLIPESDRTTNIMLRVYPLGSHAYLPPNLQLLLLDESGTTVLDEVTSRSNDNAIKLEFTGEQSDVFSIKLTLDSTNMVEYFTL